MAEKRVYTINKKTALLEGRSYKTRVYLYSLFLVCFGLVYVFLFDLDKFAKAR